MSDYYENYVDLDIDNISLNNNLFFNYNNEIEYKCTSNKKDNVLVINPGDKKCTAKFGNNPDVNMEISEIKIKKGIHNNYSDNIATDDMGEILIFYQNTDNANNVGCVCILFKKVSNDDAKENKFFNNISTDEEFSMDLDKLIPNNTKFYYVKTDTDINITTSQDLPTGKSGNIILFGENHITYCNEIFWDKLDNYSRNTANSNKINDSDNTAITFNSSGSSNDSEEFITECLPIGADALPENWADPAKNSIFSFFKEGSEASAGVKQFLEGKIFGMGGYDGKGAILYWILNIILLIIIIMFFMFAALLVAPSRIKYYERGKKAAMAENI